MEGYHLSFDKFKTVIASQSQFTFDINRDEMGWLRQRIKKDKSVCYDGVPILFPADFVNAVDIMRLHGFPIRIYAFTPRHSFSFFSPARLATWLIPGLQSGRQAFPSRPVPPFDPEARKISSS
jgi:hypothetical protein